MQELFFGNNTIKEATEMWVLPVLMGEFSPSLRLSFRPSLHLSLSKSQYLTAPSTKDWNPTQHLF